MSPTTTFDQAFPPLFKFSGEIDIATLAPVVVLLAFGVWIAFTLIATYHWFRYAHRSWVAVPALAAHVFVSGSIVLYALSGLS
jgi:hypothetical protein